MRILVSGLFLLLTSCYGPFSPVNKTNGFKDSNLVKTCTKIASLTMIQAHVTSAQALPANLSVALNSGTVTADECSSPNNFETSVHVSTDRLSAEVFFYLDDTTEYSSYFDQNGSAISDTMNVKFFSRTTCTDTFAQTADFPNMPIEWKPQYANGMACGSSGFQGSSDLNIP